MIRQADNINTYLTWPNAGRIIILICSSVWFLATIAQNGSMQEIELMQAKKDVTEIKNIVKEIQMDVKAANSAADSRLDKLEQRVGVLETVNTITPQTNEDH